jgi:anthrone oxygenase-like protein
VLTAVLVGLLAGAMVLIEVVLVPFWRGAPPADFHAWFAAHSGRIRALMGRLGAGAGVVAAASAVAHVAAGSKAAPASVAAAGATAGVVGITVAVNGPANHRFTTDALTDSETAELLGRWARWHHARVILGLAATVAAALTLAQREA